ncbi:MAG TPA: thioredoxin domain-containing protein [Longimicrobium sp.]|jgi:protein-disulfide isomerase|uniref:DsbA family protein n=1 Tax=Longimicrobium sp. TaxID=2029185 RepID=UPI002ED883A0
MNGRTFASHLFTGVLVVCAVVMTVAVAKREFIARAAEPPSVARRLVGAERLADTGRVMGRATAPVRVVEFSDFQCPFCAQMQAALRNVRARHPDRVAVVYRHFPLDAIHPHARTAAMAAECAGEQGRFEAYHDALFAGQEAIGTRGWDRFAAEAAVPDTAAFGACLRAQRPAAAVDRDARAAAALKLNVTPSLIINGELRPGTLSEAELERWILGAANDR